MKEQSRNDFFGDDTPMDAAMDTPMDAPIDPSVEPSEPPSPPLSDSPHPAREPILRQFTQWLDETLASEAPPQGFEADVLADLIMVEDQQVSEVAGDGVEATDLYALWEAITAMSGQVRLQSESLQGLHEAVSAQPLAIQAADVAREIAADVAPALQFVTVLEQAAQAMIQAQQETLDQSHRMVEQFKEDRQRQDEVLRGKMEMEVRRESLDLLIDIRDRMKRGYKTARNFQSETEQPTPKSWTGRLLASDSEQARASGAMAAALVKGYRLTLDRISEAFQEMGLEEIECLYQKYDDTVMKVIDYEVSPDVEDGVVVEVYQTAYLWHGQVYRKANVKVARQSS